MQNPPSLISSPDPSPHDADAALLRPRHVELLNEIQRIFFARGYRRLSMDDLARALRCSKRALYELAPNRKALFLLVVERWAEHVRKLGEAAAAESGHAKHRLVGFLQPGVIETRQMTRDFLSDLRAFPAARQALERHQKQRMEVLSEIVDEGIREGVFKPIKPQLVASFCLAGIARINEPDFLRDADLSFSEAFQELYQLLMTGLELK